jgi:TetR/AcrR family transcriptional regulator, regulator of cefoperazone and chloramphenicol sensitivity
MNRTLPLYLGKTTRGEETREKLLRAGLMLFGQRGFDGVSARDLATQADTPLSAMTYHFGTMEGLYTAVIETMVADMNAKIAPAIPHIHAALCEGSMRPQRVLKQLTEHLVREIVCCQDEPEWAMLMMREHFSPTKAFDAIYQLLMLPMHAVLCDIFAALYATQLNQVIHHQTIESAQHDEHIQLRAFAHLGKIIFFDIGSNTIRRHMAWDHMGEQHVTAIVQAIMPINNLNE